MKSQATTIEEYMEQLPAERQKPMQDLRTTILENLPKGFEETISYGMIGYVVPHSLYPKGYHCSPNEPLPFINIASQKNFIAIYHMGLYADPALLQWFQDQYAQRVPTKLDMGKSCIRFKKPELIPFDLIGELASKVTPEKWIEVYEGNLR
ncbi:MAG: DUF1801 domain-containing protein [Candidatus Kapaibacterium sp.]